MGARGESIPGVRVRWGKVGLGHYALWMKETRERRATKVDLDVFLINWEGLRASFSCLLLSLLSPLRLYF